MLIALGLIVSAFVAGFFVGRNNPSIPAVNALVDAGKAIVDATGKLIKKEK